MFKDLIEQCCIIQINKLVKYFMVFWFLYKLHFFNLLSIFQITFSKVPGCFSNTYKSAVLNNLADLSSVFNFRAAMLSISLK